MRSTLYSSSLFTTSLPIASRSSVLTENGMTVDRNTNDHAFRSVLFVVFSGLIEDGEHTIRMQVSADGATWVNTEDQPDQHFHQGSSPIVLTAGDDDAVFLFGYWGPERYVRMTAVVGGSTLLTGGTYGGHIAMTGSRRPPVNT